MGETQVTEAADECCVGWASGMEMVSIPEVWLELSGKIKCGQGDVREKGQS